VSPQRSRSITDRIDHGDKRDKPGWVRLSVHPTTTDAEAHALVRAVRELAGRHREWAADYEYDPQRNEHLPRAAEAEAMDAKVRGWFDAVGPAKA
jgi:hypothetical protein